jgi:hypothetical protein
MFVYTFWLFLICSLCLISLFGHIHERIFSFFALANVIATFIFNQYLGFKDAHIYVTIVDSLLLLYAVYLCYKIDKFWPIWFCSFHTIAVVTSVAFFLFPAKISFFYITVQGFWIVPALIVSAAGVLLDYRAGLSNLLRAEV